jgi:hypothetical protein
VNSYMIQLCRRLKTGVLSTITLEIHANNEHQAMRAAENVAGRPWRVSRVCKKQK